MKYTAYHLLCFLLVLSSSLALAESNKAYDVFTNKEYSYERKYKELKDFEINLNGSIDVEYFAMRNEQGNMYDELNAGIENIALHEWKEKQKKFELNNALKLQIAAYNNFINRSNDRYSRGIDNDLKETVVYNGSLTKNSTLLTSDLDLSFVDAVKYPWIKLQFKQGDAVYQTPAQIKYVQVKYDPVPEGGLADIAASTLVSALDNGSQYQFNASFKNVSVAPFDSVKVIWKITDDKNKDSILFEGLKKKLLPGDTIQFNKQLDTRNLSTNSLISLSVNPQNAQPEQFMFNNYLQTRLKVNA
ncbi:MAG: hypothetical protein ACK46R_09660, partial [Bacteroidota bacterium]